VEEDVMTTAVTDRGLAALKEGAPGAPTPKRRPHAKARGGNSRRFIVFGAAIMIMLGGAAIIINMQIDSRQAPAPEAATNTHNTGIITLAPEGQWCRQLSLDNRSGRMVEVGRVKCVGPGSVDPEQTMRERYSGGRLDTIRKSFSGGR
jgi:hypothetical protein